MKHEVLSIENLSRSVRGQQVLSGVSMRLFAGEVAFIVGSPNCGKTMLARLLGGEAVGFEGRMLLDGKLFRPQSVPAARAAGIYGVSDSTPLMDELTVSENIGLGRPPFAISFNYRSRLAACMGQLCEDYGIALDPARPAKHLTPLERLEVHCARALVNRARLVLFDNVLYMLSDADIGALMALARRMAQGGLCVLFLEPIARHAVRYGDRIFVFAHGRVQMPFLRGEANVGAIEHMMAASAPQGPPRGAMKRTMKQGRELKLTLACPEGPLEFGLRTGRIYGMTSQDAEAYFRVLNRCIAPGRYRCFRASGEAAVVRRVTYQDLQTGGFNDLSVAENIALPSAAALGRAGVLDRAAYQRFIRSEFAGVLEDDMFDWRTRLYDVGSWQRMQAVLFRALLNNADVLLLCDILDQPNARLRAMVETAAALATDRDKAVLALGRSERVLAEWCDDILLLDGQNK